MKANTKRAVVGLSATILGIGTVVAAILLLIWAYPKAARAVTSIWGYLTFITIILTLILPRKIEDRQVQLILVAIPFFIFLAGFVVAIYVKDVCNIPRYSAEDKFVRWYESHLQNLKSTWRNFYGKA